jgi:hypothetical protein
MMLPDRMDKYRSGCRQELGFDHKHILLDYKRWKTFGETFWSSER